MIDKLKLYRGQSFDPFFNLAVEEYLLQNTDEGCCTLYLWQNQNTVVIGRNQNAFKECRTTLLEDEGGKLARRLSGGGAVFHDLGNLNFTFLVPTADYDLDKQLKVIELACEKLGVKVERSGRNDILADGRKFSGNAFYKNGPRAYHHGTLMVDVDREKMGRYLNPSKAFFSFSAMLQSIESEYTSASFTVPLSTMSCICILPHGNLSPHSKVNGISRPNRHFQLPYFSNSGCIASLSFSVRPISSYGRPYTWPNASASF